MIARILPALLPGAVLAAGLLCSGVLAQAPAPTIAVCSVGRFRAWIGEQRIDPELKARLIELGFQIGSLDYEEVNEEALKPFQVIVAQWVPGAGGGTVGPALLAAFRRSIPVLVNYVSQGGGLLLTFEDIGFTVESGEAVQELYQAFGCRPLQEAVIDEATTFQQKRYLQRWFATTRNIVHPHPVTEGLTQFVYPLGYTPTNGPDTRPVRLEKPQDWEVLIRGEKTARTTGGTYPSEPPLLMVRSFGKGRVAVLPMHTTYFFNAGFHRVWERITMGDGDATEVPQGQGLLLLENLLRWLAEPAAAAGFGGFREGPTEGPPVTPEALASLDPYSRIATYGRQPVAKIARTVPPEKNDYVGVIGCYTSYSCPQPNYISYGQGSVDEYCAVARRYGLAFLVFTDRLEFLDKGTWEKLVADCKRNSDDEFIAIPGIDYEDGWGNRRMAFDLPEWPRAEWLSADKRRIINAPGFYFGENWPPIYLRAPEFNFTPPWFDKFYSGMELFSYEGTREVARRWDWYPRVQSADYNLIPVVGHRVHTPNDLEAIARQAGGDRMYLTHVRADRVADIPAAFKYVWYGQRHTYVSSGPRITDFYIENGRAGTREEPWRLYITVEGHSDGTRMYLYDSGLVIREWLASASPFHQEIAGYHDRQHAFWLQVYDPDGRAATSSAAYVSDLRHSTYMCTDLQNTLNSMTDVDPFTGKLAYYSVMGNFVTGWDNGILGILAESSQIMPPGLDFVVKGFSFGTSHRIFGAQDAPEETAVARREIPFACGDVNMLDNIYETTLRPGSFMAPTTVARSRARYTSPTPEPYGLNLMVIEQDVTFLREVTFGPSDKPNLTGLHLTLPANVFASYALIAPDGSGPKGDRPQRLMGTVEPGGYLAFYPDFYGNCAVFPIDAPATFLLEGKVESGGQVYLGISLAGQTVRAGDTYRFRWLLARGRFGEEGITDFERVRTALGLNSAPPYEPAIRRGKIYTTRYLCQIDADRYAVAGDLAQSDLPVPLPVRIGPLNGKWDAGLVDLSGPEPSLRRIGIEGVWGWFTLDLRKGPLKFAAGNLLTCDNHDVWLSLVQEDDAWYAEVHWPATNGQAKPLMVTVRVPDWVTVIPAQELKVTVPEGTTVRARLRA